MGELDALAAELSAKQGEAEEAVRSAGTLAGELEELRRKEAVENASASEAKALLSALAAAAQELLDRDEAVHQEPVSYTHLPPTIPSGSGSWCAPTPCARISWRTRWACSRRSCAAWTP